MFHAKGKTSVIIACAIGVAFWVGVTIALVLGGISSYNKQRIAQQHKELFSTESIWLAPQQGYTLAFSSKSEDALLYTQDALVFSVCIQTYSTAKIYSFDSNNDTSRKLLAIGDWYYDWRTDTLTIRITTVYDASDTPIQKGEWHFARTDQDF